MTRWRRFEALSVWWGGMATSFIIVGVEEVVEAVDTVIMAVGDVAVIVSVDIIDVGETMVGKDVGKGGAVVFGEIVSALFCCDPCTFWEHFFRYNV